MADDVRAPMEASFGRDLSHVRVHTDSAAHELNQALGARAFTTGTDVFFRQGTYRPDSSSGQQLLAHELTHVVQQRAGTSGSKEGQVSHPLDTAEQQARAVGRTVAALSQRTVGLPVDGLSTQAAAIHRFDETSDVQPPSTYLPDVLDRLPVLADEDVRRLDVLAGGTRAYGLIMQRQSLLRYLAYEERRGMGIMRVARQDDLARLNRAISAELTELGVRDESGFLHLVEHQIPDMVLRRANQVALAMLAENEATARFELNRYGEQSCTPDLAGLLEADREMVFLHGQMTAAVRQRQGLERHLVSQERRGMGMVRLARIDDTTRLDQEIKNRLAEMIQVRAILGLRYPIMMSTGYQPGAFVNADPDELHKQIAGPALEVLDNIDRVRDAVEKDRIKVWHIRHAIGAAMVDLGLQDSDLARQATAVRIEQIEADAAFLSWVKVAFAIATTVAAGIVFTPAAGAAVGAAWGLDSFVQNLGNYLDESAAQQVALDPAIADISINEPTLLWLVLDIVSLGIDAAPLVRALRPAAQGMMRNPTRETIRRLYDDALTAGLDDDVAFALASRGARQAGRSADDIIALTPQTRRIQVSQPELLASYEKLANQRMASIVTDALRRQKRTPTRTRLGTLFNEMEDLRHSVGGRQLTTQERARAMEILSEARGLARKDFNTLRRAIWRQLRSDQELERIARELAAAGDVRLGARKGAVRARTAWDDGRTGHQALEIEHRVRLSDNPWRYNDPTNLILTDSPQNQQFLEALRREGGIWPTDGIERFVVSNGLLGQASMGPPRPR